MSTVITQPPQNPSMNKYGCPPYDPPTDTEMKNTLGEMINASGLQQCNQKNSQMSSVFAGVVLTKFGGGGAGGSVKTNNTSNVGCDQVYAASKTYDQAVKNIACIINKSETVNRTTSNAINSIIFEAKTLNIACNEIEVDQRIGVTVISELKLSESEIVDIATETKAVVTQFTDALADSYTEAGATPQGQKIYTEAKQRIKDYNYNQKVRDTLKEIAVNVNSENKLLLKAENLSISGNSCKFKQGILLDLIASNIVSSVVSDAIKTVGNYQMEQKDEVTIKSKNIGPDMSLFGGLGWGNFGTLWIVLIIVVLVAIAIVAFIVIKKVVRKGGSAVKLAAQQNQGGGIPPGIKIT